MIVPAHTMKSVQQFLTKNGMTPMPHILYSPGSHPYFFVSPDEKSPQMETFCQCGRSETKNSRSTKRHQNRGVQKLLSSGKNVSIGISNGEYFEGN